jgi:hypothetical protein
MDNQLTIAIHQPNFMPWLGYFYKIWQSDIFIFLDDVQFIKTGSNYTNRVTVNIAGKSSYLTIPIKRGSGVQEINQTHFLNEKWKKKFIGTLQANYAKAPYFNEHRELIFELINFQADNLADYNMNFIKKLSKEFNFNTKFKKSSNFHIKTESTQRLIELITSVNGKIYLSGEGGDNYQEHQAYKNKEITVTYNKMPKFSYRQLRSEEFISGLSIIDAIFAIGIENLKLNLFTEKTKDIL